MDREAASCGGRGASTSALVARSPARLCGVVDLRLRSRNYRLPCRRDHYRHGAGDLRTNLVAPLFHRAFRELPAFVERRSVLLCHGHPSVGEVLHGRMAWSAARHLGHWRHLLCRFSGGGLYGLLVPAELRLSVDQYPGQGRYQFDGCWCHFQRHQLRPDAHVAHHAPTTGRRRPGRSAHPVGPPAGSGATLRTPGPTGKGTRVHPFAGDYSACRAAMSSSEGANHRHGRRFNPDRDVEEWHGRYYPYDLGKGCLVALVVVVLLVVVLAVVFSSPDEKPVTVKSWSTSDPIDFAQTAITELDGTSAVATYGPPYNTTAGSSQSIGPFSPESWLGVHHPIDTANDFVLAPLRTLPGQPRVDAAIAEYTSASPEQQAKWTVAYEKSISNPKVSFTDGTLTVPAGSYGPVGTIIGSLTSMARSGALDGALLSSV